MAATIPSATNVNLDFVIDDLMDLEVPDLPVTSSTSPAKEGSVTASVSSSANLQREENFELIQSSYRLRSFIPVKVVCAQLDGTHMRLGYTFTAKVLLKPIAGLYGNFVGSEGGKK